MTFCLGTLLKEVKEYELDQSKTNETFVNEFLGCINNAYSCDYLDLGKTAVSKILNCKYNMPEVLKSRLKDPDLQDEHIDNLCLYVYKNLQQGCFDELSAKILQLCNKNNKMQLTTLNKLNSEISNANIYSECLDNVDEVMKLSRFLSVALIEAAQTPNIIETDQLIASRGNSVLCLHSGSIFKYCFNRKSKSKNIVVIPVETCFGMHVSRKFEGSVKQEVSDKTLHGMWIEGMLRRSNIKKKIDNVWTEYTEDSLRQRILNDLETRGRKPNNKNEFPLGTIAVLEEANSIFYLLAASEFDENNNAHATKSEIKSILRSLLKFYDNNGQGQDMYLPLIGTGMTRAGFSNQESFDEICEAFNPENSTYVGKVTIVVLPDVYKNLKLRN